MTTKTSVKITCDHCGEDLSTGGESQKTSIRVTETFRPNPYQYQTLMHMPLDPPMDFCNHDCLAGWVWARKIHSPSGE